MIVSAPTSKIASYLATATVYQVDLILLNFTKAFNNGPHFSLLTNLKYYDTICQCPWIQTT